MQTLSAMEAVEQGSGFQDQSCNRNRQAYKFQYPESLVLQHRHPRNRQFQQFQEQLELK